MGHFGINKNIPMLRESRVKPGKVWILELLIFALVFIVASNIEAIPVSIGTVIWLFGEGDIMGLAADTVGRGDISGYLDRVFDLLESMPAWLWIVMLFATVLVTITVILFCRWLQKRRVPSLGLRRKHAVREYVVGALMGICLITLTMVVAILTGGVTEIRFTRFNALLFVLYLLGYMVQGMSEEVLCRGYLMPSIARRSPIWLAVVLSSLTFSLLHFANPGFGIMPAINIFLTGVVFAVYVLKRGNLWGACAMHSFWNFFQGNIFGISVSGNDPATNSTLIQSSVGGANPLWSGGDFGLEGSLCITIVMLAALAIELFVMPPANDGRFEEPTEVL
ncbi:MAG: CPBP family intramembrane metalloprotease [Clostridia bacterium]|nr:CPBP family intramembrane metalloprotease [Clostridia bacterium]